MSEGLEVSPQSILFGKERKRLIENELYKNPQDLFSWAEDVTKEAMKIENWMSGNNTALKLIKILSSLKNSENIFQEIIEYGKSIGIESEVNTSDCSYHAAVVVSTYLDKMGLGFTDNPPTELS